VTKDTQKALNSFQNISHLIKDWFIIHPVIQATTLSNLHHCIRITSQHVLT